MDNKGSNVPILMIFFNRSEPLKLVFEAVRNAKPSKLFLAQDGARKGHMDDIKNVELCRKVVENIDWDCEVYTNYAENNLGCGARMSSAISWAFESVDRLMILEDDCVPSNDFFPFCEELLEKYKDDERISMISAMNHLGKYANYNGDSYIFCNSGAIWGWATWKREWQYYDFNMKFINELNAFEKIRNSNYPRYYKRDLLKQGKNRKKVFERGERLSSWTFQYNMIRILQNQLTIVPSVNMSSNVGLTCEATHASSNLKMIPKGLQKIFFMQTYEINFPLKHPQCVYCDNVFDRKVWTLMGMPLYISMYRKCGSICRRILFGGFKEIKKIFKKAFKKE